MTQQRFQTHRWSKSSWKLHLWKLQISFLQCYPIVMLILNWGPVERLCSVSDFILIGDATWILDSKCQQRQFTNHFTISNIFTIKSAFQLTLASTCVRSDCTDLYALDIFLKRIERLREKNHLVILLEWEQAEAQNSLQDIWESRSLNINQPSKDISSDHQSFCSTTPMTVLE